MSAKAGTATASHPMNPATLKCQPTRIVPPIVSRSNPRQGCRKSWIREFPSAHASAFGESDNWGRESWYAGFVATYSRHRHSRSLRHWRTRPGSDTAAIDERRGPASPYRHAVRAGRGGGRRNCRNRLIGVSLWRIPGGPARQDAVAAISALVAVALFVWFLPRVRSPWVPAITYSTLATLALLATYDLSRFLFPKRWFESLWLYEHVAKMIG